MSKELAKSLPELIAQHGKKTAREISDLTGYHASSVRAAARLAGVDLARDKPGPKQDAAPMTAGAPVVDIDVVRMMVREELRAAPVEPPAESALREAVYKLLDTELFRQMLARALLANGCAALSSVLYRNNGRAIADALFAGHPPKLSQSPARTGADRLRTMVGFEGSDAFDVFYEWLGPTGRRDMGAWIMKAVRHEMGKSEAADAGA